MESHVEPDARSRPFMGRLEHPLKEGIEQLRAAILGSNDQITEHMKWNAPSFRYSGEGSTDHD